MALPSPSGSRDDAPQRVLTFVVVVVLALLSWIAGILPVHSQTATHHQPGDAVSGAGDLTYADLLREIVPDLVEEGGSFRGQQAVKFRHISGPDFAMEPPETVRLYLGLYDVPLKGSRRLVLVDLGQPDGDVAGYVVLALFDLERSPRLVDAVLVGLDQMSSFALPPVRDLGNATLAITSSMHFNSSQGYMATAMVLVRGDSFEAIDEVYTFDDSSCAFERAQRLTFATQAAATGFHDIVAWVSEYTMPTGADCGDEEAPKAATRTITVTYRWDAAQEKYLPDSDAFDKLAAENSERH
jgi:hypothetical protein